MQTYSPIITYNLTPLLFTENMNSAQYCLIDDVDNASTHSVSTNATEDNIPGAGRTIGLAYGYAGGKLEKKISQVSEKLGYGPRATALKIERIMLINHDDLYSSMNININLNIDRHPRFFFTPSSSEGDKLTKYCNRLLNYIRCASLYLIYHIFSDIHCSVQMYQQLKCRHRKR